MHIHFVAIGGAGINPLARFAKLAGYTISGSDLMQSKDTSQLIDEGVSVLIGDALEAFLELNKEQPIDWVVYSSAVSMNPNNKDFFKYLDYHQIKHSKRDQFMAHLISKFNQKMIAIAGTHGKTTTTAMLVYLLSKLGIKANHLLAAKVEFANSINFDIQNQYLVYEADEFDRNFLSFKPYLTLISGLGYDHQEIYPTLESYKDAFHQFAAQSKTFFIYDRDKTFLDHNSDNIKNISNSDENINKIKLKGLYNREDGYLVSKSVSEIFGIELQKCLDIISTFPGLYRRMEEISANLYTDYAHTPEKIKAAINTAQEMCKETHQKLIVVYEPLTNRRQLHIKAQYSNVFDGIDQLYWVPSYLAREDPDDKILSPKNLIKYLNNKEIAKPIAIEELDEVIRAHITKNDFVLCMSGGGAGSLDEWLRDNFAN